MADLENALKDFLKTSRSMESNIVTVISDSNRDIEMILKELLIYLDSTSKHLEKVQDLISTNAKDVKEDETLARALSSEIQKIQLDFREKIRDLEVKMSSLNKSGIKQVLEFTKQVGLANQKLLKQVVSLSSLINDATNSIKDDTKNIIEMKELLRDVSRELTETKDNVSRNQDNLMEIINNIMNSDKEVKLSDKNVEAQKIQSEEEKFKAKLGLVGKIIGIVLGSGGVIYLIIDSIIKAANGG